MLCIRTQPLSVLQATPIIIIKFLEKKKHNYKQPAAGLLLKLRPLEFYDFVDYEIAKMTYKVYNNVLHSKILNMIEPKDSKYELGGLCLFEGVKARTTTKNEMCFNRGSESMEQS